MLVGHKMSASSGQGRVGVQTKAARMERAGGDGRCVNRLVQSVDEG